MPQGSGCRSMTSANGRAGHNGRAEAIGGGSHRDLPAWQRGMDLATAVYRATADWPPDEIQGLTLQVRQAAIAIPANIAAGYGWDDAEEFNRRVALARHALVELETSVHIALRLNYLTSEVAEQLLAMSADVSELLTDLSGPEQFEELL